MNYFELYPGDYLRDTTRLTLAEHGAYLRLLMAYYSEEKPLPKCDAELYVIVSAVSAADKAAVRKVADRFFPAGDDGQRRNGRADAEIEKAQRRINVARENGSKGGRKPNPAGNPLGIPVGNPAGIPPETQRATQRLTQPGEALHTPHVNLQAGVVSQPMGARAAPALPDWLPPDAWHDWHTFRNQRKGWTPKARELSLATLRRLHADGNDPVMVINRSIECGWTGLFPLPENDRHAASPSSRKLSAVEQVEAAIRDRRAREADGQPPAAA